MQWQKAMIENEPTLALLILLIGCHISGYCVLYARLKHRNLTLPKKGAGNFFFFGLPFFLRRVDRQAVSLVSAGTTAGFIDTGTSNSSST